MEFECILFRLPTVVRCYYCEVFCVQEEKVNLPYSYSESPHRHRHGSNIWHALSHAEWQGDPYGTRKKTKIEKDSRITIVYVNAKITMGSMNPKNILEENYNPSANLVLCKKGIQDCCDVAESRDQSLEKPELAFSTNIGHEVLFGSKSIFSEVTSGFDDNQDRNVHRSPVLSRVGENASMENGESVSTLGDDSGNGGLMENTPSKKYRESYKRNRKIDESALYFNEVDKPTKSAKIVEANTVLRSILAEENSEYQKIHKKKKGQCEGIIPRYSRIEGSSAVDKRYLPHVSHPGLITRTLEEIDEKPDIEEKKLLRRVKNRESVEKCRTRQRLRMETLEIEETCLIRENVILKETLKEVLTSLRQTTIFKNDISDKICSFNENG